MSKVVKDLKFVIHTHTHGDKIHYDVRMQKPGTKKMWSFAVPKHKIPTGNNKYLALKTEDHPISFYDYEGEVEEEKGTGDLKIYDSGKYDLIEKETGKIEVEFKGNKVKGRYAFAKMNYPDQEEDKWLFVKVKHKDDEEKEDKDNKKETKKAMSKGEYFNSQLYRKILADSFKLNEESYLIKESKKKGLYDNFFEDLADIEETVRDKTEVNDKQVTKLMKEIEKLSKDSKAFGEDGESKFNEVRKELFGEDLKLFLKEYKCPCINPMINEVFKNSFDEGRNMFKEKNVEGKKCKAQSEDNIDKVRQDTQNFKNQFLQDNKDAQVELDKNIKNNYEDGQKGNTKNNIDIAAMFMQNLGQGISYGKGWRKEGGDIIKKVQELLDRANKSGLEEKKKKDITKTQALNNNQILDALMFNSSNGNRILLYNKNNKKILVKKADLNSLNDEIDSKVKDENKRKELKSQLLPFYNRGKADAQNNKSKSKVDAFTADIDGISLSGLLGESYFTRVKPEDSYVYRYYIEGYNDGKGLAKTQNLKKKVSTLVEDLKRDVPAQIAPPIAEAVNQEIVKQVKEKVRTGVKGETNSDKQIESKTEINDSMLIEKLLECPLDKRTKKVIKEVVEEYEDVTLEDIVNELDEEDLRNILEYLLEDRK